MKRWYEHVLLPWCMGLMMSGFLPCPPRHVLDCKILGGVCAFLFIMACGMLLGLHAPFTHRKPSQTAVQWIFEERTMVCSYAIGVATVAVSFSCFRIFF